MSSTPQAVAENTERQVCNTENMERQVCNKSNNVSVTVSRPRVDQNDNLFNENVANISTSQNNSRPQIISWGDHDVNDPLEDFDMEYFPSSQGLMSQSNNNSNNNQGLTNSSKKAMRYLVVNLTRLNWMKITILIQIFGWIFPN